MITNFVALTADAPQQGSIWTMIVPFAIMILVMYFLIIRPQNKKKKAEEKMRKELQVGDEITTIGGLLGKVVSIKEESDSLVIETGSDRSRIRIKKWAVASCETVHDDAE